MVVIENPDHFRKYERRSNAVSIKCSGLVVLGVVVALNLTLWIGCAVPPPQTGSTTPGGSTTETEAKPRRVAVVTPYMANETTKYVIERFKEQGEARGWEVGVTDTAADFNLLVSRIEDAVTQNVDAIVLGMGDPAQMTKGLEAAQEKNIPVFGLDAGIAPGVLLNVTSDNTDLGVASAKALIEAINEKGGVIMFTHDPHPGVRERAAAGEKTLTSYPGITILEKKHIDVPGPVENARAITEDLLTAYPEAGSIAGIWAGWDEPALGALQAIEAAGRAEIVVVGIDGTDFARAEIAKGGPFIASVAQDFDSMAARLAELIEGYFAGQKPTEEWYKMPGRLITKENVEE
jgi:ribose transport system substrate-binding protein